jgi:WhiB family redox-sensing transcriptional regulator
MSERTALAAPPKLRRDDAWWRRAACSTYDPDVFFHRSERSPLVNVAKRVCGECPVRLPCLRWAMTHPGETEHGVWGGTTPSERSPGRQPRRRSRPI